jgi:hypothetical protein
MRFLTTSQLARLAFHGSRSAANKRLRKLLDLRYVRVWVRSLAEDNVYSLTSGGAQFVVEQSENGVRPAVPRAIEGHLEHLLAINTVRITVALAADAAGGELLWWRSDWELRAQCPSVLIPDALFAIGWENVEQAFALEVDNRTRSTQGFVRKALRYLSASGSFAKLSGIVNPITLVVGQDERRLERYRRAVGVIHRAPTFWFAPLAELEGQGAMAAVWRGVHGDEKYSLRALSSLPCSTEGPLAVNAGFIRS